MGLNFVTLGMVTLVLSLLIFNINTNLMRTNDNTNTIISTTRAIDNEIKEQIQQTINQQGNLTAGARQELINQFAFVANRGGFATHQDLLDLQHSLLTTLNETTQNNQKLLELQALIPGGNTTVTHLSNVIIMPHPIYLLTDAFFSDGGWGTQGLEGVSTLNASAVDGVQIPDILKVLKLYSDQHPKLIIAQGFQWGLPALTVASSHPDTKFVVMTGLVNSTNVQSIYPAQQQGSFVLGALAAMISKTHVVGFVGGQEYPNIINIEEGFKQGAHYIDPNTRIVTQYTFDFNNTTKGKNAALSEINQGADIILHTADTTGQGVIREAQMKGIYALGVVADQNNIAPNTVLSSFVLDMKKAYTQAYERVVDGKFVGNIIRPGLEMGPNDTGTGIIYIAPFHSLDSKVSPAIKYKLIQIEQDIISHKIIVPERSVPTS